MKHIGDFSRKTLRKESVGRTRSRWDFNIKLMLNKHGARAIIMIIKIIIITTIM
jgi:hypothetical protein